MQRPSKFLRPVAIFLLVVGALGLGASIPVMSSYEGKAALAQRVEKDTAGDLFGDAYRNVGEPQEYVIEDQKAYIEPAEDGTKRISEDYLKEKGIYPTQLRSVRAVVNYARIGFGITFLLGLAVFAFAAKRSIPPQSAA